MRRRHRTCARSRGRSIRAWRASISTDEGGYAREEVDMNRNTASIAAGCVLALCGFTGAAEAAKVNRDWKAHPVVVEVDTSEDIFAIGDPHGDPQRLAAALAGAKLI